MPKLILPTTSNSTIEIRKYPAGTARHVRAVARYLYRFVPGNVVHALIKGLFPTLTTEQVENMVYVRLRRLGSTSLEEIEKLMDKEEKLHEEK